MGKKRQINARPMGFLAIRCEKCGDVRGFSAKEPITYSRCKLCDRKTVLTDLAPAVLRCKCGRRIIVSTNMTDPIVTIVCPICQAPVDLELDRNGSTYRTLEVDDE